MSTNKPNGVTTSHLAGSAGIYVRQGRERDVESTGSLDYQRGQMKWPLKWGWPAEAVQRYEDLGLGGSLSEHRPSFVALVADIQARKIRVLFASDLSRLTRKAVEWLQFLDLCRRCECLLVFDGVVLLGDGVNSLTAGIAAFVDEHESQKFSRALGAARSPR